MTEAVAFACVPPKTIQDAYYYEYYRKLETKIPQVGLVSTTYSSFETFKLEEFSINATMKDSIISSEFKLKYINNSTSPVEAKYTLPLPPTTTVCAMSVEFDDKLLVGRVKEKEKATNIYSDAIASGGQGFMAEIDKNGYFVISLGNVPPGKEVSIILELIGEVGTSFETYHYFIHKCYFPKTGFKFNFKLNVQLSAGINKIETLKIAGITPNITYEKKDGVKISANITLNSNQIHENLLFFIVPAKEEKPSPVIEYNETNNTYAFGMNFYPDFKGIDPLDIDQKSEFIFVLDCSGSMSGTPIANAKKALQMTIRSLSEGVKFNIVNFGSGFNKLFPQSAIYSDETLEEATLFLKNTDANLGGTELLQPLKSILGEPYDSKYPRQVIIFTDGEVDNREGLIDFVSKESYVRLFTYGIGSSVDKELIIGLSKSCRGYYSFITNISNMEKDTMDLFNIALEPMLYNIKIDYQDLDVTQSPSVIRPIFNSERFMIYGIIDGKSVSGNKTKTIKLTGSGPRGDELTYSIDIDFEKANKNSNSIHRLAAFNIIRDLVQEEDKNTMISHKDKIVSLGKQYGIVSKHTSYIVTNEAKEPTLDTMKSVDMNPTKIQEESEGKKSTGILSSVTSLFKKSAPSPQQQQQQAQKQQQSQVQQQQQQLPSRPSVSLSSMSGPPPPPPPSMTTNCPPPPSGPPRITNCPPPPPTSMMVSSCLPPQPMLLSNLTVQSQISPSISFQKSLSSGQQYKESDSPLLALINGQKANGSFEASSLETKLSEPPKEIEKLVDVWITLVVLAKFTKDFSAEKDKWILIYQKAMKFIRSQLTKEKIDVSIIPKLLIEAEKSL